MQSLPGARLTHEVTGGQTNPYMWIMKPQIKRIIDTAFAAQSIYQHVATDHEIQDPTYQKMQEQF